MSYLLECGKSGSLCVALFTLLWAVASCGEMSEHGLPTEPFEDPIVTAESANTGTVCRFEHDSYDGRIGSVTATKWSEGWRQQVRFGPGYVEPDWLIRIVGCPHSRDVQVRYHGKPDNVTTDLSTPFGTTMHWWNHPEYGQSFTQAAVQDAETRQFTMELYSVSSGYVYHSADVSIRVALCECIYDRKGRPVICPNDGEAPWSCVRWSDDQTPP